MNGDTAVHYQFAFNDEVLEDSDHYLVIGESDIVLAFHWLCGIGFPWDNCFTLVVILLPMSVFTYVE